LDKTNWNIKQDAAQQAWEQIVATAEIADAKQHANTAEELWQNHRLYQQIQTW